MDAGKVVSVTFPVDGMDWHTLQAHRMTLANLQARAGDPAVQDALDTALAIIEQLMSYCDIVTGAALKE